MNKKQEIYDRLSAVLTDYEEGRAGTDDLYHMLVSIQNAWETVITAEVDA